MRILHVIPGLTRERGGPTAVVQALARHQAAAGHDVIVLTTDQGARNGEHAAELAPAVRLERHCVRGPDRLAYAPGFRAAVRGHVHGCDVVHVHSIFTYPVHVALQEAFAAGRPVVLRPCGLLHPYGLRRSRWVKRGYLALWGDMVRRACSVWHYTSDQEAAASWPRSGRHFVLPNGVEAAEFAIDRTAARHCVWDRWPQLEQRPFVLFLGRLHGKKRLGLLVESFLAGAPESHRLVVAGPDEEGIWPPLRQRLLAEPAAARRVHYVGGVAGGEKAALLAGADLFALPSEHENFGIAALEALAAGTPVLLSPHVDLVKAVEAVGCAFVAPVAASAWAARLADLLARPERLAALAEPARAWAAERYSWAGLTADLLQQYQVLLRARPEKLQTIPNVCVSSGQLPDLHLERGNQPAPLPGQPPLV
jgi:glycosyltransferase involved in cell wall biosynthesis